MKENKHASQFIDGFIAYMTGREKDHTRCIQTICIIEWFLNNDAETLVTLFLTEGRAREAFRRFGKASMIVHVSEWFRQKIAGDKLIFCRMGLLKPKRNGDLRSAKWETREREQFFGLFKHEVGRRHPGMMAYIGRESGKLDPQFLSRLLRIVKKPALKFEHVSGTPLQQFLLRFWIGHHEEGFHLPPLYECSDPTIAKLVKLLNLMGEVDSGTVKKTWERLGLRKAPVIMYKDVRKVGSKIVFSETRPRR